MSAAPAGRTYDPALDGERLRSQMARVRSCLLAQRGAWWSLEDLVAHCGGTTASISARVRQLRTKAHGALPVEAKRIEAGLWHYRVAPEAPAGQMGLFGWGPHA
jgi:hypothetical protein